MFVLLSTQSLLLADAYQKCVKCHGVKGELKAYNRSRVIAEMSRADIINAIHGYKDGSYGGPMKTLMQGVVADLTENQIAEIAEKIAK